MYALIKYYRILNYGQNDRTAIILLIYGKGSRDPREAL